MQVKLLLLLILVAACTVAHGWKVGIVRFDMFSGTPDNPDFNSHAVVQDRHCESLGKETPEGYTDSVFECDPKNMRYAWARCRHCTLSWPTGCESWSWWPQGKDGRRTLFCDNGRLPMDASEILTYLGADPSDGYFVEQNYLGKDEISDLTSFWAANKCIKEKDGNSFKVICTGDEGGFEIFNYNGLECSRPVRYHETRSTSYCGEGLRGCNIPLDKLQATRGLKTC